MKYSIGRPIRNVAIASLYFTLAACGAYLHDDTVQQNTTDALNKFQAAGLSSMSTTVISTQDQLDDGEVSTFVSDDNASREMAIAQLLAGTPGHDYPCDLSKDGRDKASWSCALSWFEREIEQELRHLASGADPNMKMWVNLTKKDVAESSKSWPDLVAAEAEKKPSDKVLKALLQTAIDEYSKNNHDFASCKTFSVKPPCDLATQTDACNLFRACQMVDSPDDDTEVQYRVAVASLTTAKGVSGRLPDVHSTLTAVQDEITQQDNDKKNLGKSLSDAQVNLTKAQQDKANGTGTADQVADALDRIKQLLDGADTLADAAGHPQSAPGKLLAAVKFRKTNLLAVLDAPAPSDPTQAAQPAAASAPAASAAQADSPASAAGATGAAGNANQPPPQTNTAIADLILGIGDLHSAASVPTPNSLNVALMAQLGMEQAANGQMAALRQQELDLRAEQRALLLEYALLVEARSSLETARNELIRTKCTASNFSQLLSLPSCEAARPAVAGALSAYNLAWASGRTAASVADLKVSQQIYREKISVSLATLNARVSQDTAALTTLAKFGGGGIKPETIADVVQAIATVVIAKKVN